MDIGGGTPTIKVNVELKGAEEAKRSVTDFGVKGEAGAKRFQQAFASSMASAERSAQQTQQAISALTAILAEQVRVSTAAAQAEQAQTAARRESTAAARAAREAKAAELKVGQQMADVIERERRMILLHSQALEENARRSVGLGAAAASAVPNLNAVRGAMQAMAQGAVGAAPGMTTLTGLVGSFAIGAGPMAAILGGIAAIGYGIDHYITGPAKRAKEALEKQLDVLRELVKQQKLGVAGVAGAAVQTAQQDLQRLSGELAKILLQRAQQTSAGATGLSGTSGYDTRITALQKEIAETEKLRSAGLIEVARLEKEANDKRLADEKAAANERQEIRDKEQRAAEELIKLERDIGDKERDRRIAVLATLAVRYDGVAEATARAAQATIDLANAMKAQGGHGVGSLVAAPLPSLIPDRDWNEVFFLPPLHKVDKYADDISRIFRDGIGQITSNGLRSFEKFFSEVQSMSSKLMRRMEEEAAKNGGVAGGFKYNALGLASAGISGGLVGYQVGQQLGSAGSGALGGAAAGAMAGAAFGPWGAAIGGLAGLTAGLLGGAKAARERAAAEEQLRVSLATSINAMRVLAGTASPLSQSLLENAAAFTKLRADTEAAYAGTAREAERNKLLRELNDLEAIRIRQLQDEQAALNTANNARIDQQIAEQNAANAQRWLQEFSDANQKQYADSLEALNASLAEQRRIRDAAQAQLDTAQDALNVAKQSLEAQQRVVDETRRVRDSLVTYSNSLKLNSALAPLSPIERYNEARRQYDAVASLAAGGDKSAIASLPQTANAFLEQSKAMYSSTQRYAQDYDRVQAFVSSLTDQYSSQLTVEEQILGVLQSSQDKLAQQVNLLTLQTQVLIAQLKAQTDYYVVGASAGPHADPNFYNWWLTSGGGSGFNGPPNLAGGNPGSTLGFNGVEYDAYQAAHGGMAELTESEWLRAGSPAYASGGRFGGGAMLVGERGPELVRTGPASVDTSAQFTAPLVRELRELQRENATLQRELLKATKDQTRVIRQSWRPPER